MIVTCYLVVNSSGGVRTTKSKPNTVKGDEVAIGLRLSLPGSLFTQPTFTATIEIPENAAAQGDIPVEVQMRTLEAIERATGMKVELEVTPMQPTSTARMDGELCEVQGCKNQATTIISGEFLCWEHAPQSGRG